MSSWYALNVKYVDTDGEFSVPELPLSKINAHKHPFADRGFDLLLDTFATEVDPDDAIKEMIDIAVWKGTPVEMVFVSGSDTADIFSFKKVGVNGVEIESWGEPSIHSPSTRNVCETIEEEIGCYPSRGGNYRNYE